MNSAGWIKSLLVILILTAHVDPCWCDGSAFIATDPDLIGYASSQEAMTSTTTTKNQGHLKKSKTDYGTTENFVNTSSTWYPSNTLVTYLNTTTPTSSYSALPTPSDRKDDNLNDTMHQYSNTSDQLVQYHFNCKADEAFCSKISNSINAAINEFTQVVNIKVALL